MMQRMHRPDSEDLEMQQLDGMLEKILDIQHPERVQEKLKQTSEVIKGVAFTVSAKEEDNVSLLDNDSARAIDDSSIQSNAFYSFDDFTAVSEVPNAIEAVIHETQTVVNGSTIKLRLVSDIYINGTLVSQG